MPGNATVNKEDCISCQLCADALPQVFYMDSQGLAEVHDCAATPKVSIQKIINACPKACILWAER